MNKEINSFVEKNETRSVPAGVTFRLDTLYRTSERGDNWCITWCADDSQIVNMDDGNWLSRQEGGYHNHLYRISGGPENFERHDIPHYPDFTEGVGSWFGYGIVAVDGAIYVATSKTPDPGWSGPFRGVKLLKSTDNGVSWSRVDRSGNERILTVMDEARNEVTPEEMFSLAESGRLHQTQEAYPFSYFDFVQHGRNNASAPDDYLYIYGPEGAHAHQLLLARAKKQDLGKRDAWEYFVRYDDEPIWTRDIDARQPVFEYPQKNANGEYFGWYSWLPSIVWNEGLGLYIMVNGGTYAGHGLTDSDEDYFHKWMHTKTGSLGFWYAENPCGPWHAFFYTDYWTVDDPTNLIYQPKLSPKWISEDGREMVLIWSDAMKNAEGKSHRTNYSWNQMKVTLKMAEETA
ncbi:MAG: DUF4185 domain-containing protein [Candidatus Latescibacteria bacterium]|nr:DUF4185 domain-containing protein [Candidatus Latescibacterota bacterium]MBT4141278.1 DUF4185 domain-containing protein [Candidatus Latescibacterota bacterium]MBT5831187.1 DUF4185 domain-containing protein [Candidatus Latescibacterota bacterium]